LGEQRKYRSWTAKQKLEIALGLLAGAGSRARQHLTTHRYTEKRAGSNGSSTSPLSSGIGSGSGNKPISSRLTSSCAEREHAGDPVLRLLGQPEEPAVLE
jgi:hypothetical protein